MTATPPAIAGTAERRTGACDLALVTRAHDFLTSTDSEVFLRGARGVHAATPADSARGGCLGAD